VIVFAFHSPSKPKSSPYLHLPERDHPSRLQAISNVLLNQYTQNEMFTPGARFFKGFGMMPRSLKPHQDVSRFQVFSTGGVDLAVASAQNCRSLEKRGSTVRKRVDCLIATFCIETGHWLLHNDHDFDPFEKHLGLSSAPSFPSPYFRFAPPRRQDICIYIGCQCRASPRLRTNKYRGCRP
jgi:hypothetical protein